MLKLTNQELISINGGTRIYAAPTYALFMKVYKFTYGFIKSLIW